MFLPVLLTLFISNKTNGLSKIKVIQERAVVHDVDETMLHACGEVYMYNRTNKALNFTFTVHFNFGPQTTVNIMFYKWTSNEYRVSGIQISNSVEKMLKYSYFDLQSLFHNYTTPPLEWPVKREVCEKHCENIDEKRGIIVQCLSPEEGKNKHIGMSLVKYFSAALLFSVINIAAKQNFRIKHDHLEVSFLNRKLVHLEAVTFYYNRTSKANNMSFTSFTEVPDNSKLTVTCYKWMTNSFRLTPIQFSDTVKNILNYKTFGIHEFLSTMTKPPLLWPIKLNVTYSLSNYIAESHSFPLFPDGLYKTSVNAFIGETVKVFTVDTYDLMENRVDWQVGRKSQ